MRTALKADPAIVASRWNQAHEIGRCVCFRNDRGEALVTKTRSEACVLGGHTAVIWIEGVSGCVALDRVSPIVEKAAV